MSPLPPGSRTRQKGRLKSGDWSGDAETTPAHGRRISQAELYNRSLLLSKQDLVKGSTGDYKEMSSILADQ
jgi:hypothetical protein